MIKTKVVSLRLSQEIGECLASGFYRINGPHDQGGWLALEGAYTTIVPPQEQGAMEKPVWDQFRKSLWRVYPPRAITKGRFIAKKTCREIETEHSGCLKPKDTFYAGNCMANVLTETDLSLFLSRISADRSSEYRGEYYKINPSQDHRIRERFQKTLVSSVRPAYTSRMTGLKEQTHSGKVLPTDPSGRPSPDINKR